MIYVFSALAVYKMLQIILILLPKEPMTWVKVLGAWILAGLVVGLLHDHFTEWNFVWGFVSTFVVATLAGLVHTVNRLLTYLGDLAARKSIR